MEVNYGGRLESSFFLPESSRRDSSSRDSVRHLVQEEDEILHIHNEELPPDEYYEELEKVLLAKYPGATPSLVEHVVALIGAFDTAAVFCVFFGIAKFQLAQTVVKLVGELVGREGRSPNPEIISAVRNWPPVHTLKELQQFLGTINYIRPHCGPAFARIFP